MTSGGPPSETTDARAGGVTGSTGAATILTGAGASTGPTSSAPASDGSSPRYAPGRALRPSRKLLPEHARGHNRSLVLQTLYRGGRLSRADLARRTGLTRVTTSDLVAELLDDALVVEVGQREGSRPGKPATLLEVNRSGHQIIGLDLSERGVLRGAVLDLDGLVVARADAERGEIAGEQLLRAVVALARRVAALATAPVLGVGVGTPGVVDPAGTVLSAPNLGWTGVALQSHLSLELGLPVVVANDANAAALAEHTFGGAESDLMLIRVGLGVGAGLLLGGSPLFGSRYAAGEIGHVVVGTDGGERCACGKRGCLETWLSEPRLAGELARIRAAEASPDEAERRVDEVLREAGKRLGIALGPVVGALNLAEIVLSGPEELLSGPLLESTADTVRARTMQTFSSELVLRTTDLGPDIVLRGAAALVLSGRLGVS
ncbi:ROK family protein [Microbacteriaceae bacterium 4G12]